MERNGKPRRRPEAPSAPTTLTEITRRYYACAVALARVMGLPMTEDFLRQHRESISCCFIEAGRAGVRLPPAVPLPPLGGSPAASNGQAPVTPPTGDPAGEIMCTGMPTAPEPTRLTADQARDLKKLAHTAFGFAEGERRLRADLGFEPSESLTLRHLAAHVTVERYQTLMDGYAAVLRQAVEADLPDFPPPASNGQGPPPEPTPDERQRWGALSRRSMQVGLSATTWDALRQGDYAAAERVIVALERPGAA